MIFNPFKLGESTGSETWTVDCLGNNVVGWYDGTDSGNMVLSGSDVTQLTDLSGNNNHLISAVTSPPQFSTDHITMDNTQAFETTMSLSTDYGGFFIVMNIDGLTANPSTLIGASSTADDYAIANQLVPLIYDSARVRIWENGSTFLNLGTGLQNQKILISSIANSTLAYGRSNGFTELSLSAGTNRFNFDEVTVGSSFGNTYSATMDFYELIVFKGDITTDQFESIEWYLTNKHGLTLDAGHTYVATDPATCDPLVIAPPSLDMTAIWDVYFSAHNDYQSDFNTTGGGDGNDYFISGRDAADNVEIITNTSFLASNNEGNYLVNNGLQNSITENASLKMSMIGDNADNYAHGSGDFTMFVVYTWDGNTNDTNYKHWAGGTKGFKIQGASSGINISDGFNTSADDTGTASGGETFEFDPAGSYSINSGNPFFFCVQRDTTNKKYIIYTGEITSGNTAADIKIHDTASDSSWYVTNPYDNSNSSIEFKVDEDSVLHAWGFDKSVVPIGNINSTFEFLVTRF